MAGRTQKAWAIGMALFAAGSLGSVRAYGDILPGSIWPNGNLETAGAAFEPNSPQGPWRRGGGDFADPPSAGPYTFDFWDNAAGTVSGTHALRLTDNATNGNGEWFMPDFGPDAAFVPIPEGSTLRFHFFWNYNTTAPAGVGADMRVTIRGTDGISGFGLGPNFDFLANGTTGGVFQVADFVRTMPAGVTGIRMNIASGGDGQVTGFLAVDDISVVAVPEPTSAIALAGAAGMLIRRRHRRA
jgi:hypothetical protein